MGATQKKKMRLQHCLAVLLLLQLSSAQRHYFHNFPDNSNFTAERLQYAIERDVLREFYSSTNPGLRLASLTDSALKPDWTSADRWLSGEVSHCMWEGVHCNSNGSILALFLPDNNLGGTLTPRLLELPHLKQLWLFNNKLGPSLPSWLSGVVNLEVLLLQNNNYEGRLPASLSNLQHLRILDLSGNRFGENIAGGDISKSAIRNAEWVLDLRDDSAIPESFANFSSLEDLDLSYNVLHGTIPAGLANVTSLRHLWLASNRLEGTVPETFSALIELRNLSIELNLPICSNTTGVRPPEHITVIPGTNHPNTCPFSAGPPNADNDDAASIRGMPAHWDDAHNYRHPLDRGVANWTYCGPHASPMPLRCEYSRIVPASVANLTNLTLTWSYPTQGTLAVSASGESFDSTQQTRHHRREHREALYPYQHLIPAEELASESGLSGSVNMWNDKQWPHG